MVGLRWTRPQRGYDGRIPALEGKGRHPLGSTACACVRVCVGWEKVVLSPIAKGPLGDPALSPCSGFRVRVRGHINHSAQVKSRRWGCVPVLLLLSLMVVSLFPSGLFARAAERVPRLWLRASSFSRSYYWLHHAPDSLHPIQSRFEFRIINY